MIFGLFGKKNGNRRIVEKQYATLTTAARRPYLYEALEVPDTVMGRFEMLSAMLRFPRQRLATFTVSNGAADAGWYELVGTRGSLCLAPAYEYAEELEMELTIDGRTRKTAFAKRDQFAPELLHFSDCIRERREPGPSGAEGLADVRIIEALLESAERGRPIRLPEFEAGSGPGMDQEIRLPPVRKPDLVDVQQPHPS